MSDVLMQVRVEAGLGASLHRLDAVRLEDGSPCFLLWKGPPGSRWLLLAASRNEARDLEHLAHSFVGPSYGSVSRLQTWPPAVPRPAGAQDHLVVVVPAPGTAQEVEKRILTCARLLQERPERRLGGVRTLGQVLSDFRVALAERDRDSAEALLEELESRNDITRTNLVFLRVQMLGRVGAFDELLAHPDLSRIAGSRRPRDVTQALLEAVEEVHLSGLDYTTPEQWATSGTQARRLLGPVATTIIPPRSAEEARVLVAAELADESPDIDRITQPVEFLRSEAHAIDVLMDRVAGKPTGAQTLEPVEKAPNVVSEVLANLNRRRFGEALESLEAAVPQLELVWAAFNVHKELGTDASQRAFVRMAKPLREELESDAANLPLLEALDDLAEGGRLVEDPADWDEWLDRARSGATAQDLVAMAERGAGGWPSNSETAERLASFISTDYELLLRPSYGFVLARHEDGLDTPAGTELVMEIVEMVVTAGATSQELGWLPGWVESVVSTDNRAPTVSRLIEVVRALMTDRPSPVLVSSAADVIAVMAHHPVAREGVLQLAEDGAGWMRRYSAVAHEGARVALAQALEELGAPRSSDDPFWFPPKETVLQRLRGKRLGFYTLMSSVATRIKQTLDQWVGDGDVQINDDHVATDRLVGMAQSVDMLFMVSGAAKHAATDAIKEARGNLPMVQVHRKGFTALYEAVRDWARDLPSS